MTAALKTYRHYILLVVLLAALFIPLIVAGLDLGFVGDSLGFEQNFTELGLRGGMRYTLLWDRRHLLSGQYFAVLHTLFPGQSAAWYGSSLLLQFVLALFIFQFSNALLKGQWRWLSFSAALIAIFHTRQVFIHFEIPNSQHMKVAFMLALLSLYCYLRFVRGERKQMLWRDFSIGCYLIGVLSYEAGVLFFLLNPLIAYIEERDKPGFRVNGCWVAQLIKDSFWYPIVFIFYFYLLNMLLPPNMSGGRSTTLSIDRLIQQFGAGLDGEFAPAHFIEQFRPAFQGNWLFLTTLLTLGIGILIYGLWRSERAQQIVGDRRMALLVIGVAMIFLNIAGTAPTDYALNDAYHSPRLASPSAIGIAFALCAGLSLLLERIPLRRVIFAGVVGLLVAVGITRVFQVQQIYVTQHNDITEITQAIKQAIPAVRDGQAPYFLIIADAEHNDAIHSRDIRFPLYFDMTFGIKGGEGDGVYTGFPANLAPEPNERGIDYHGPSIVIEPDAIYSPLNPGVPIERSRLIMLEFDPVTNTAQVVPSRQATEFAGTNVTVRGDAPLESNLSLIDQPQ